MISTWAAMKSFINCERHIHNTVSINHNFRRKLAQSKPVELKSCVKVEVAVLSSPSVIFFIVSVDVKQH